MWRNGKLWFEDLETATVQNTGGYANALNFLGHYANVGKDSPSPKDQSIWFDDLILTNERPSNVDSKGNPYIGIGDVKMVAPPNPPSMLLK